MDFTPIAARIHYMYLEILFLFCVEILLKRDTETISPCRFFVVDILTSQFNFSNWQYTLLLFLNRYQQPINLCPLILKFLATQLMWYYLFSFKFKLFKFFTGRIDNIYVH